MAIPKPQGVTCEHKAAWAYLTVPVASGHGQEVEYRTPQSGDWEEAARQGVPWLVPLPQVGVTQWRARYTRPGATPGEWGTGRAWIPGHPGDPGFEEDGAAPRPLPPRDLHNVWSDTYRINLIWAQDGTVDRWRVIASTADGSLNLDTEVTVPEISIGDIAYDQTLNVDVRAVVGDIESESLTAQFPSAHYVPATPADLVVVAGETTLELTWAQAEDFVQQWQVMWNKSGDAQDADAAAAPSGTINVYGAPTCVISGLEPGTSYDVIVSARWRKSSYSTGSASKTVSTRGGGTGTRPAWIAKAAGSTSTRLEVEWEARGDEAKWSVQLDGQEPEYVPGDDEPRFSWDNLEAGSTHTVTVRTKLGGAWLPKDTAAKQTFTLDETPPPPTPAPPTGLFFHCIADTTAKAEWSQAGEVDGWEVWFGDDREQGSIVTVTRLVNLKNLDPGTTYIVNVVSVVGHPGTPGYRESEPASGIFTTLESVLPPDENPSPIPGDLEPPSHLMVRAVSATEAEAVWADERPEPGKESQFYVVSIDGVQWERVNTNSVRFTDLAPGRHVVHVYGVIDNRLTGIARKATSLKENA